MSSHGGEYADLTQLRERAEQLLQPPVLYLPIRHHSPTCAAYVKAVIEHHRPAAVLVEGPPSFDAYIDLLLNPETRTPVAIYSHARFERAAPEGQFDGNDEPVTASEPFRFSSYFPLCDYSPELVALAAGRGVDAHLGFIDLDYHSFARFGPSTAGHVDERVYEFSDVLQAAAERLGCRDHNELWDQMVEGAEADTLEVVASVLTYGTLARDGSLEQQRIADGTRDRELAMAGGIADALTKVRADGKEGPVVVVTGAFHTVALPELVEQAVRGENSVNAESSSFVGDTGLGQTLDHGHGLIRYSFDRLDALNGYGAGMPSPCWYQSVWEHLQSTGQKGPQPTEDLILRVAQAMRSDGDDGQPSFPSAVDAMVAAQRLSDLRGRGSITRNDAIDAMVSCFTKSEDSPTSRVRLAAARQLTGFKLGAVPPGTPRVPLAVDFDRVLAELDLTIDSSEPRQVNLDVYRSERDRKRSRFFHGVTALGVSFGTCITPLRFSRASGRDVIRERWNLQLGGATDASLAEASVWGASIGEAVAAKTRSEFLEVLNNQPAASTLMRMVMVAAQRGVPAVVADGLSELRQRVAVDPSLDQVVDAMIEADLLWSAREPLGGTALDALPELVVQLFARACQLGGRLDQAPEGEWKELVKSLDALHRIVSSETWAVLDQDLYWAMLADQRDRVPPGLLEGAIGGLEWRGGRRTDHEVVELARGHIDPATDGAISTEFLTGLILVAREALWEIDGMVGAVSEGLGAYGEQQFLRRLPGLRAAFAALTPRQTDQLAEAVAVKTGARASIRVTDISEPDVLRHAGLSAAVAAQLRADGLDSWLDQPGDAP